MSGLSSGGAGVPAGSVIASAQGIPAGFLECNGAAMSRTVYAALFLAIGTAYGVGDGATTFNLPDLRGEFIRGFDNGRGVDAGRVEGASQADDFGSHSHSTAFVSGASSGVGLYWNGAGSPTSKTTTTVGGAETRPRNVAMTYSIKY